MKRAKVLVVDDEIGIRESMRFMLSNDYEFSALDDPTHALELLQESSSDIDVVFTDLNMPHIHGISFLKEAKRIKPELEVVIITGYPSSDTTIHALRFGATDYLIKPFNKECLLEVTEKALARKRRVENVQLLITNLQNQIRSNYLSTTKALIFAIDASDSYTKGHCDRIANIMKHVTDNMAIPINEAELWCTACSLHDIGKIGITQSILRKPASLTPAETVEIQQHSVIGYNILRPVEFLKDVLPIILHHHERYDGLGYPSGLSGKDIPIGARVLAILDSYDAIISNRPYRRGLPHAQAMEELRRNMHTQFDPDIFPVVLKTIREVYADAESSDKT